MAVRRFTVLLGIVSLAAGFALPAGGAIGPRLAPIGDATLAQVHGKDPNSYFAGRVYCSDATVAGTKPPVASVGATLNCNNVGQPCVSCTPEPFGSVQLERPPREQHPDRQPDRLQPVGVPVRFLRYGRGRELDLRSDGRHGRPVQVDDRQCQRSTRPDPATAQPHRLTPPGTNPEEWTRPPRGQPRGEAGRRSLGLVRQFPKCSGTVGPSKAVSGPSPILKDFAMMVALALLAFGTGQEIDVDQFNRLIQVAIADVRDVTFVYEGDDEWVAPDGSIKDGLPNHKYSFQGTYSYRSDGATLLDVYSRNEVRHSFIHKRSVILKGKMESYSLLPDERPPDGLPIQRSGGGPGSLTLPQTPQYLNYLWFFYGRRDPSSYEYEVRGWEEIDGNNCLSVTISRPKHPLKLSMRFWIDMARGGHPLKVEFYHGPRLAIRVDHVQLMQFSDREGRPIWLPVRGEANRYDWKETYYSNPTFKETYAVVPSSVLVNQGLADDYFNIKGKTDPITPGLRAYVRDFANAPPQRSDPAGVKERLNKLLAEADKQSKALSASSVAREATDASKSWRIMLVAVGIILVLLGITVKKLGAR